MSEQFYTILTSIGQAKIANSGALGTKLNLVKLKVGDGGGAYYNPIETQIDIKNKVWEGNISSIYVDETNSNWIVIETVIPTLAGGFTIREAGIFDDENKLIAIGKYPETYKPIATEGSSKDLLIRMILEVSNTESVNLKIDPTIVLATKKDIETLESKIQLNSAQLSDLTNKATDKNDLIYQIATGTATALIVPMQALVNGYAKTFIANSNNSGAATTINGKPLYKPGTTTAPNLIAGKAYTVWYNATGSCFFIKASAEGDALAIHVLKDKKFSNDNDTGLVGTLDLSLLVSDNIKAGITINGVAGNYNPTLFIPGTTFTLYNASGSLYVQTSQVYTEVLHAIISNQGGTLRVTHMAQPDLTTDGTTMYTRIYVNGVARGIERVTTGFAYITYVEDITINPGDRISLYCRGVRANSRVMNMKLTIASENLFYVVTQ